MVQPHAQAQRDLVGGSLQERDCGDVRVRGQRNRAAGFEDVRDVGAAGEVFGRMMGSLWRPISASLRFTDGVVIGCKEFLNEVFEGARERFCAKRKDGARKMRGAGTAAAGVLWTARDPRVRV